MRGLLNRQSFVSDQRAFPTDDISSSKAVNTVTGETVQLQYWNAGVLTDDAGEAIGTTVVGKLAIGGVKNSIGDQISTYVDSSLSFTSTALTNEVEFPFIIHEKNLRESAETRANAIVANFAAGDYCVDSRTGTLYSRKASITTTLTATTYITSIDQASGGGGGGGDVNLDEVGGTATSVNSGAADAGTQRVSIATDDVVTVSVGAAGTPEAQGIDATGQDAYATVITPTADAKHMMVTNEGAEGAIISIDAGVTDQFTVIGGAIITFDDVDISSAVAIQAKNQNAGSNYADLAITIW